ncbi:MAG: threonine synthase [Bacteroidota bacterium]|nr:threonine synthase [Bacteroidota bacterium]
MKTTEKSISLLSHLVCSSCCKTYDTAMLQSYAACCNAPLSAVYHPGCLTPQLLAKRPRTMWRYAEMLPVLRTHEIVSLGEGFTPIHTLSRSPMAKVVCQLLLKDESVNPTGSFKARGISAAISKAKELGVHSCVTPTAGNAGSALSAYCAAAGMKASIVMPSFTAQTIKDECRLYGAEVIEVNGLINECGTIAQKIAEQTGAFNMSTMKEPYRLEGKKTLGYEIAEQLNWHLPDVIIYPTGGGTGLLGMWKAFHELISLNLIQQHKLPRMVIVQTENCDPMIRLVHHEALDQTFKPLFSKASGLAVPYPFAANWMLQVLQESNGTALTVTEEEMDKGIAEVAASEGLLLSPEGSATYMGLKKLIEKDWIKEDESVLLINTGSWYKYH